MCAKVVSCNCQNQCLDFFLSNFWILSGYFNIWFKVTFLLYSDMICLWLNKLKTQKINTINLKKPTTYWFDNVNLCCLFVKARLLSVTVLHVVNVKC